MTTSHRNRISLSAIVAAALLALFGVLGPLGSAQAQDGASESGQEALLETERNTIDIVNRYGPSVVAVNVTVQGRMMNPLEGIPEEQIPPFLRDFLEQMPPQQQQGPRQGSGSGFVVDEDGHIVTNYHVVQQALQGSSVEMLEGAEITVTFPENGEHPVRVLGVNALYDLALLELENPDDLPDGVTPIPLADEGDPQVGQKVIAIGNPYGFASTVTTGIVSGVGRNLQGVGEVNIPLVQTDAAINPGNSGGPLLGSDGRLIGVNTAIIPTVSATGQRGSLGIGFAVPSTLLSDALAELGEGGFVSVETRPRLGITIRDVDTYPEEVRGRLNLPDEGVGVLQVERGGAADEAGIRGSPFSIQVQGQSIQIPGDVITEVDGEPVGTSSELQSRIFALSEGDTVTLTILRDGETQQIDVELSVVPQNGETEGDGQED